MIYIFGFLAIVFCCWAFKTNLRLIDEHYASEMAKIDRKYEVSNLFYDNADNLYYDFRSHNGEYFVFHNGYDTKYVKLNETQDAIIYGQNA